MKTIVTILIAAAATFVAAPNAEARPHYGSSTYISHHTSCGCPVYVQRYVAYRMSCGRPVYRTRTLPPRHVCRHHASRGHRANHYDRGYRGHYDHGRGYHHRSSHVRIGPVVIESGGPVCR